MKWLDAQPELFASVLYAEPGALGLIANIVAALIVAIENICEGPLTGTALVLAGTHLIIIGGILQLIAGLLCFRRNDHLTGTAFVVFSSLWIIVGANFIMTPNFDPEVLRVGVLPGLIGFMAVAVILCLCAVTVNYIMPPVLVALLLTLIFEGVGSFYPWGKKVAAAFEIFIVLSSSYAVIVMTLKGVSQRYLLPGFGNAPFDPLLIRTKAATKKKHEKKKDTKYAEPMGMGYIGNVVPAAVLVFHHLGYFSDFRPAMPMFVFGIFCHILGSFYAFLRHDLFHSVQFVIYFVFWTTRAMIQLFVTLDYPTNDRIVYFGQWGMVGMLIILMVVSTCQSKVVFLYNFLFTIMSVLSVEQIPVAVHNYTFGVSAAVVAITSLYVAMAHLANSIAEKSIMFLGLEAVTAERLTQLFNGYFAKFRDGTTKNDDYTNDDKISYKIVDCVGLVSSALALSCLAPVEATSGTYPLTGIIIAGVFLHLFTARLAFAAGSLAKCYIMVVLALFWSVWTAILFDDSLLSTLRPASIAILCLHTVSMVLSAAFTRVWIPFSLMMELCAISLVVKCFNVNPPWMILVTAVLTAVVAFYGAFAEIVNGVLQEYIVPVGEPILKEVEIKEENQEPPCPLFSSQRTSSLMKVADILDDGGVVGTPTDTVYALGASCKHPESIKRIYHIKGRPPEKPICLCLSNLDQLVESNPVFSPLLWAFMRRCYPGGISCVVPKGPWMQNLGLGDAVQYVGTKESICIRVPDSSVLAYLVSLSGPIALTSANPSGGADSIHHDMVIDSLGHKLDGIICDGESNELVASTVVNCLKIDEGVITYFRIGCTPKERVDQLFEDAKAEMNNKSNSLSVDVPYTKS
ncbi:uncharacterized protein LOC126818590 [Patella vulgata]|uniref:uncharacterized protein LOC126818590 n=1 Tax=Patella vulgata TaxID=6465 RepID=UPI00217F6E34|nr:uncharacterized protein LOC126818590 [Patella vulgata]